MMACPECGKVVKHYSSKNIYAKKQRRYYKCSCKTKFTTDCKVVETIVKVTKGGRV